MKYFLKNNKGSFIAFPSSFSIRATKLSLENFKASLLKKDPNLVIQEFAHSRERRLEVQTTKKTIKNNIDSSLKTIIHQETDCLLEFSDEIPINSLVENIDKITKWMDKLNKRDYITIEIGPKFLKFKLNKKKYSVEINTSETKMDKLLLLDGSNVLTKGYFATKKTLLRTSDGLYTNGVLSFIKSLFRLIKQYRPTHIAVCWDCGRDKTFRKKLYPAYKANRSETEPELKQQYETMQELLRKMNIPQFFDEEYEADDLIGTLVRQWNDQQVDMPCYFHSNDKDLHQLLNANAVQVISKNGENNNFILEHFEIKYGVTTEQWIDVKALLGDPGDNIPGVKGVGDKAAIPLIQNYGSIELLYEQLESLQDSSFKRYFNNLVDGKEDAFLSKQLSRIVTNVPSLASISLENLKVNINKQAMVKAFHHLEFTSLLNQIQNGAYRVS